MPTCLFKILPGVSPKYEIIKYKPGAGALSTARERSKGFKGSKRKGALDSTVVELAAFEEEGLG